MLFKLKTGKNGAAKRPASDIDRLALRSFLPFAELDEARLKFVRNVLRAAAAEEGEVLLQHGSEDPYSYFLVSGRLELEARDGKRILIEGGSERARNPISDLRPRQYSVKALSPVRYFTVDSNVLSSLREASRESSGVTLVEELVATTAPAETVEALWQRILADLERDKLVLPTLPDVAFRIGRALRDEKSDAERIASIVQTDPAITAKVVKTANSALYGGRTRIETCRDAVVRLGFEATSSLVISFALQEVLQAKSLPVRRRMKALWHHSVQVASLCYVLAGITRRFSAERALLAGLLHDIGAVPVVTYADDVPEVAEDDAVMDEMVARLRGKVGEKLLQTWGFAQELVEVPGRAEDWLNESGDGATYADLVIVAQIHSYIGTERARGLPALEYVPAFKKLFPEDISPKDSIKILRRASDKVSQIKALLGG